MYLKSLEVIGFKSFAKKTEFTFNTRLSAVVGPNGCGKSNVVDAIRWVLGEQSLKALRTKKSEDLIFSGSDKQAKKSLASVSLTFDNRDRFFNLDFENVVIGRKLYRNGENEYLINNSKVRLKDIAYLVASAKLGLKGYTIVNQGMADAILSASLAERREIFDDALGLKEFQLKREEAERKLEETRTNLERAKDLVKEIAPHLKFLKKQAEKITEKEDLEQKLRLLERAYVQVVSSRIFARKKETATHLKGVTKTIQELERNLIAKKKKLEILEEHFSKALPDVLHFEEELEEQEDEKNKLERELGRLEGMIESRAPAPQGGAPINFNLIKEKLDEMHSIIRRSLTFTSLAEIKAELRNIFNILEEVLHEASPATSRASSVPQSGGGASELSKKKKEVLASIQELEERVKGIKEKIKLENLNATKEQGDVYVLRNEIQSLEFELRGLRERDVLLRAELKGIEDEEQTLGEEHLGLKAHQETLVPYDEREERAPDELRREIEKIKIKLEFVGAIDPEIEKEYKETLTRYEFLTRESEDLEKAIVSLRGLIKDLEAQIEEKFESSFSKISEEFDRFFRLLFGGGKAKLMQVSSAKVKKVDPESEEDETQDHAEKEEYGVDIKVDLPGKRVGSVSSLSGGEKALTSVALLFALISTSPPPFLVLDEVDAALDEANSVRLGKILDELSSKTQFIVITHNREIMKGADILYGITMDADNTSKLLSLSFEKSAELVA